MDLERHLKDMIAQTWKEQYDDKGVARETADDPKLSAHPAYDIGFIRGLQAALFLVQAAKA